ncbi:hypothetical protein H8N00_28350 [Streptomyces sp. AC563]|uniref:hypothetical protein n=1 Tax=Streptomyces buecherae TaxID=2763006 RepID=UPI00164D4401|nr:hypothetical protein [Streptomyces buecherae]MBC3992713.1 hypothetical protein [Streptomyces buecherae]
MNRFSPRMSAATPTRVRLAALGVAVLLAAGAAGAAAAASPGSGPSADATTAPERAGPVEPGGSDGADPRAPFAAYELPDGDQGTISPRPVGATVTSPIAPPYAAG